MSELVCLEDVVGLSQNDCECYETDRPADYNQSKSGYYLDQLPGLDLKLIGSDVECGDGNIWEKMESALQQAKVEFRTDVLASITEYASPRRKPFNGRIGETKKKTTIVATTNWMGLVIQTGNIKGGEFTLKGITTLMDSAATFDVYVYNNIEDDPLIMIPDVQSAANQLYDNPLDPSEDLIFPLYSTECDDLEYYIVYMPAGFNPKDNKISCGCSRRPDFEQWFHLQGTAGNDIADREGWGRNDFANGLLLDLCITCNTADLICGGDNVDRDWQNDPVSRVIAATIRYKAGVILVEDILNSGNINRYTMMNRDYLKGRRSHYNKEYGNRIMWLGENMSINGNDCLGCDDDRISSATILS